MRRSVAWLSVWLAACGPDPDDRAGPGKDDQAADVNLPPTGGVLALLPVAPSAAVGLVASWTSPPTDPEGGPVTVRWSWERDGLTVDGAVGPEIPAGSLTRGQVWTVHAVADDGVQDGVGATATTTVGDAAPTAVATLSPDPPRAGLPVRCAATEAIDADGDAVTVDVAWTVNGAGTGAGAELGAASFGAFDRVGCALVARTPTGPQPIATATAVVVPDLSPGNVLLLVMDDIGAYDVGAYGAGQSPPRTPGLDALAAQGVTFTRAWGNPLCTPSRGSIMTGRYPFRTGVGDNLKGLASGFSLPTDETTIAQWLGDHAGYARQAIGKWHLSTTSDPVGPTPLGFGFEHYLGMPANLDVVVLGGLALSNDYFAWQQFNDDVLEPQAGYLTTSEADDAIDMMATMNGPWFLYVAFHAAHTPLHEPPGAVPPAGGWTGRERYKASVEALDAEIARVVAAAPPDTTVIVVGDNGGPHNVPAPPYEAWELKGSTMEGGIRIPWIVRSPYVGTPGSTVRALVHLVDLFPTLADIARAPVDGSLDLDGHSLVPFLVDPQRADDREVVYSERFEPTPDAHAAALWHRALRDDRYKVVRVADEPDGCFELGDALRETVDLYGDVQASADAIAACDALADRLDRDDVRSP